jgi:hypothetical protein
MPDIHHRLQAEFAATSLRNGNPHQRRWLGELVSQGKFFSDIVVFRHQKGKADELLWRQWRAS